MASTLILRVYGLGSAEFCAGFRNGDKLRYDVVLGAMTVLTKPP